MKLKFRALFLSLLIIILNTPTFANTSVKISFPNFPISINGTAIKNENLKYPLIIYNDITYFPMTYNFSRALGLNVNYTEEKGLKIEASNTSHNLLLDIASGDTSKASKNAIYPYYPIEINGRKINNTSEAYPILNYNNITYFPLTWNYAVNTFGWKYSFDNYSGLKIEASKISAVSLEAKISAPKEEPISKSEISANEPKILNALDFSQTLPSKFNTYDRLDPKAKALFVRNQGDSGTCWAFAANTLFEIALALQHQVYLDLSEDHLILNSPIPSTYDSGGYIDIATTYYTSRLGPVLESEDTFGDKMTNPFLKPQYVLTDYIEIRENLKNIKHAIYQFGAAQSSIEYFDETPNYNSSNFSFFNNNTSSTPSHDIILVGWDDNYPKSNFRKTPKENGAFIAQNSWGENWGQNGLFYISYEDVHILNRATAFTSIKPYNEAARLYSHNPTGITHFDGFIDYNFATGLNVFKARSSNDESLTRIAFYTSIPDVKYTLLFAEGNMPESKMPTLKEIGSGIAKTAGYHTVKLDSAIKIPKNSYFMVGVRFENENSIHLIPVESPYPNIDYKVTGKAGESFLNPDTSTFEFSDITAERPNANIGIRAITE